MTICTNETPLPDNILQFPGSGQPVRMVPRIAPVPEPDGGGKRHDGGKNRLDLLPVEWSWALADVTTKGSYKYDERNWERGMAWGKMIGCVSRHIAKFCMGERYDKETGCHHLAMAAWNILALMTYDLRCIGVANIQYAPPALGFTEDGLEILERVNSGDPANPKIRAAMGLPGAAE